MNHVNIGIIVLEYRYFIILDTIGMLYRILLEYYWNIDTEYYWNIDTCINTCFSQSYFRALPMNTLGRMWSMMVGQKWD